MRILNNARCADAHAVRSRQRARRGGKGARQLRFVVVQISVPARLPGIALGKCLPSVESGPDLDCRRAHIQPDTAAVVPCAQAPRTRRGGNGRRRGRRRDREGPAVDIAEKVIVERAAAARRVFLLDHSPRRLREPAQLRARTAMLPEQELEQAFIHARSGLAGAAKGNFVRPAVRRPHDGRTPLVRRPAEDRNQRRKPGLERGDIPQRAHQRLCSAQRRVRICSAVRI